MPSEPRQLAAPQRWRNRSRHDRDQTLIAIHDLAQRATADGEAAALLAALPQALHDLRVLQLRPAAQLAEGYHYLHVATSSPELLQTGIRTLLAALESPEARAWDVAAVALECCWLCRTGLEADTLDAISAWAQSGQQNDRAVPDLAAPFTSLVAALDRLWPSTIAPPALTQLDTPDDRLPYLIQIHDHIGRASRVWIRDVPPHERVVLRQIAARWGHVLAAAIRTVRGRHSCRFV